MISWLFFCNTLTFCDFLDDVGIAYKHEGCYRVHQIQLLFDHHQQLAYTPKDPHWRVSRRKGVSEICIETSVELSIKNAWTLMPVTCIFCCWNLQTSSDRLKPLQSTTSNHFNEMLWVIQGSIIICIIHRSQTMSENIQKIFKHITYCNMYWIQAYHFRK